MELNPYWTHQENKTRKKNSYSQNRTRQVIPTGQVTKVGRTCLSTNI